MTASANLTVGGRVHTGGMTEQTSTRPASATFATRHGWRYLLGALSTAVPVDSATDGIAVISTAVAEAGEAGPHLAADLRDGRVLLTLKNLSAGRVGPELLSAAERISAALAADGHTVESGGGVRSIQAVEIGIDTLDRAAIRPFWKAVMGYIDDVDGDDDPNGLIDPLGQGPALWFQDMDEPRPQRNRLHFDLTVGEDEVESRLSAALAAGGTLLTDQYAKAFWVLADAEGNEICLCTWQDRD